MYSHSHARRPYEPRTRTFYDPKPPTHEPQNCIILETVLADFGGGCFLTSLILRADFWILGKISEISRNLGDFFQKV